MGTNFCELLIFYKFVGTYFCVFTHTNKGKYDFETLVYKFIGDVNTWMRGTHEFHEN